MSKFITTLTKSNKDIMQDRAENVGKKTALKQKALVDRLEGEVLDLEGKIQDLCDLAPEHSTALKPQDFDEEQWVKNMQQYKVDLLNKRIELDVARKTYKEWFGNEEEG